MDNQTLGQYLDDANKILTTASLYPEDLAFLIEEDLQISPSELQLRRDLKLDYLQVERFNRYLERLLNGESPQYIVGHAYFYGEKFKVNQNVLIPRFETEELVAWAKSDLHGTKTVLDLGTGSGVIAAILAQNRDFQVFASDISPSALDVAKENFARLNVDVQTTLNDGLSGLAKFDVIVSNPPYIKTSEKSEMDASVIKNEPEIALFAGVDGLDFYRQFMQEVDQHLNPDGSFYLEFGFAQKEDLTQLAKKYLPEYKITFRADLSGHDRMMKGEKPHGN